MTDNTTADTVVALAMERPITQEEAAEHLRCSLDTLRRWQREHRDFPVHRTSTRGSAAPLYFRSELNQWLRSRCSEPAAAYTQCSPASLCGQPGCQTCAGAA